MSLLQACALTPDIQDRMVRTMTRDCAALRAMIVLRGYRKMCLINVLSLVSGVSGWRKLICFRCHAGILSFTHPPLLILVGFLGRVVMMVFYQLSLGRAMGCDGHGVTTHARPGSVERVVPPEGCCTIAKYHRFESYASSRSAVNTIAWRIMHKKICTLNGHHIWNGRMICCTGIKN